VERDRAGALGTRDALLAHTLALSRGLALERSLSGNDLVSVGRVSEKLALPSSKTVDVVGRDFKRKRKLTGCAVSERTSGSKVCL
jgi:hypothetical protein